MSRVAQSALVLLWILLLAALGWKAYTLGQQTERQRWQAQAAKAAAEYRAKEQQLTQDKHAVEMRYEQLKKSKARSAAAAQSELDGLRLALAHRGEASADSPSSATTNGAPIERGLLAECAAEAVSLAKDADQLSSQVIGLQDYINSVVLKNTK